MKTFLSFIIIMIFQFSLVYAQQDAGSILKKVDQATLAVTDKSSDVEMRMINLKNNNIKVKKAILLQKGLDKKLFRYTYPKSDSGIASLTIPEGVYLYLPMFKKPKKITNLAESNAFNKSDFSLKDANTKPYSKLYTPLLIESDDKSYILKLIPKDNDTEYSYLIATISKTYFRPVRIEYYNKKGEKVKISESEYTKIDNLWVTKSVSMKNLNNNHMTKFIMTNIKVNSGLSNDLFKVENMK